MLPKAPFSKYLAMRVLRINFKGTKYSVCVFPNVGRYWYAADDYPIFYERKKERFQICFYFISILGTYKSVLDFFFCVCQFNSHHQALLILGTTFQKSPMRKKLDETGKAKMKPALPSYESMADRCDGLPGGSGQAHSSLSDFLQGSIAWGWSRSPRLSLWSSGAESPDLSSLRSICSLIHLIKPINPPMYDEQIYYPNW